MITIFDWFGYELSMDERYQLIKEAGFDGVLLWWDSSYGRADHHALPRAARQAGLWVEDIHAPTEGTNNLWLDTLDGESWTQNLLQCVEDCAAYEIPAVVIHLSNGDSPPPTNTTGLERLKRIADRADQLSVNIALENLRKLEYLSFALDQIDSPHVGFCYDSGHHNCRTPDTDLLSQHGARLMALHLHDNAGYISGTGEEDQHRLPFDGTIDWTATMCKIAAAGYTGPTALEVVNMGYTDRSAADFLRVAFERARRLEAMRSASGKAGE